MGLMPGGPRYPAANLTPAPSLPTILRNTLGVSPHPRPLCASELYDDRLGFGEELAAEVAALTADA